jgi:CHAT domain-containing protein
MRRALRRALYAIALVAAGALVPSAQQRPSSADDLNRDLAEAERLLKARKTDEATAAFQAIVDAARAAGLEAEEARAQCGLGETLSIRTQYTQARTALERCLDAAERLHNDQGIGRALIALSQVAELTGRMKDAEALAERAVAVTEARQDPRGRAFARSQLLRIKRLSDAEEEAITQQIVEDARLIGDRELEARALHSYGDHLFNASRFEEAFETLTRARDLYQEAGSFTDVGTVYNSLGRVYRAHGRLDEALKCQQQALAIHEKYGAPFELMQSLNAVAVVQDLMGNIAAARVNWERALTVAQQSSSPRIQDFLNANIAKLLLEQGEYERAARMLEGVIARGLDTYPSLRYSSLVYAYIKLRRPADAVAAANRALDLCQDNQLHCLTALENRAAAFTAANDEAAAKADIRKALETIEGLRAKLVPADFLKQNFHEVQQDVYSAGIAIAFKHHDDRESLETAELASSRAFLDLLAAREGSAAGGGTVPGLTLRGAPAAGDLPSDATASAAKADDLTAIAKRLRSTAVVYWPADDALYVWVVKGDGSIASRRVEISRARLIEMIAATAPGASAAGRRPWRELYDVLVAPIRDRLPGTPGALLTIIPHGALMNVSFAALQNRDGRYLLEDYAMHYAPAGAVLRFTAGMRRADARTGAALLVADPVTVRRSPLDPQLPPLPGARSEVAGIAAVMARRRVTRLEGREATEPRVTAAAVGKAIVHLATHAIVRDDAPHDSYLAFGPASGSPNGLLTAREVYGLRLTADLVVLSACRSGGGRVTGDGIAAFARAFMYAGTPSLVVSRWDVADAPTSRLLPAFYRMWLGGASKARSLRRAQLRLLEDLRAGAVRVETRAGPVVLPNHPMFWAGFVLIGEPE